MQKLEDSELRYRRLFEATQDGILILDAKTGMIEDVNPYLINMLGYSRAEFVEKKLWEVGAFRDIEASKDAFEALQEQEYIRYEDLPLKAKDGRLIQVEFVSNVYVAGGEKVIQCNIRDTTEHRRIISALQSNEKKYHDLINQSPDGYFIIELSGKILTINKAMSKELEFSEEEFLSMSIWDIIPEEFLDQYREKLTKILNGESLKEAAEYEVRGKNGTIHYVEVLSAPRYSGRDIIGFQGIARDISAHKRTQAALLEAEARFRRLVEHLPTVVYMNAVGDASSTLYVSPQIESLLGYTPQEWLADPKLWSKVLHPEDRPHVLAQTAHVDQINEPFDMEYRMITRDGRLVWVHDKLVLVNDLKGLPQFWQGIMLDITERKKAEQSRREIESRFRGAFDFSAIGMALVSLDGHWLDVNLAFCQMIGYFEQELLTKTFQDITHPDDLEADLASLHQLLAGAIPTYKMEKRYIHKNGQVIWALLSASLVSDAQNQPLYFVKQIQDITESKQAEQKLSSAGKFLQSVQDALSAHITILDREGTIVQVNSAWRAFGEQNGLRHSDHCIGMNYLDVCDSASGADAEEAALVAYGIRQVLNGEKNEILVEYPCHSAGTKRWFVVRITSFENNEQKWIAVSHQDITKRKKAEERIQRQLEHLTALSAIDRVIAANFNLEFSLSEILTHVTTELGIDAADILILNSNLQILEYGAARGFRIQTVKRMPVRLRTSYAGRAVLERQLIQIQNLRDQAENSFLETHLLGEGFVCYYGMPLITKGQVKGVLEVFHRATLEPDTEWLDFLKNLAGRAAIAIENGMLFESLQRSNSELTLAYDATIEGWSRALDLRDKETEGHSLRVTDMTVRLAHDFGLSEAELMQVRWGALLHDIGKMGVPDSILLKPGSLTDEE
nr:PAS domain S-box protein [Chloroflexota bacterium]